jgi:hypothetical protein
MAESISDYDPTVRALGTIEEVRRLVAALEKNDTKEAEQIMRRNNSGGKSGFGSACMFLTRLQGLGLIEEFDGPLRAPTPERLKEIRTEVDSWLLKK